MNGSVPRQSLLKTLGNRYDAYNKLELIEIKKY